MKRILLATDGSSHADEAAKFLSHLPHEGKWELVVVTVLDDPSVATNYAMASLIKERIEEERKAAVEAFHRISDLFVGANVELKSIVLVGHRGETICELAKQEEVDLVLVGARGHTALGRLMLGSTSDYVATHAHCSVLVYRPMRDSYSNDGLKVLIGYENSSAARDAVTHFCEIPWGPTVDVSAVYVVSYMAGFLDETIIDPEPIREAAQSIVDEAALKLRSVAPSSTGVVVASEHVGEGLVNYAESSGCDLIVIGETHRSALGRFLLGSFSRYVLRHAHCSVWISRTPSATTTATT